MRILLTGASGFIGAPLLHALAGHEVVCLGRALPGDAPAHASLAACNLADAADSARAIAALAGPFDAVVHLAVSRLHRTFPQTALDMFQVNVAATALLLDAAQRLGASRFVLGSTGSVYDGIVETPLREDMVLAPRNYFPVSKFAAEELTRAYEKHFAVSILRYFTPYGPGQTDRLIPGLITRVREGQPVSLPQTGGGLAFMATAGRDCVEVARRATLESWRGVFNVAAPEPLDLSAAAEIIGRVVGKPPAFERVAGASALTLLPDVARVHAHMPGHAFTRFEEGIRLCLAG
jgi:UDP-glucose 4-epimerase